MHVPRRHSRLPLLTLAAVGIALSGCGGGYDEARSSAAPRSTSAVTPSWPDPSDAQLPAQTATNLQSDLRSYATQHRLVGVSAAVVTATGSWAGAAGVDGTQLSLRPDSTMAIGGTTQTFIAAEILRLWQRGRIDLDAPATDYVRLPFDARGATIRQLATMTASLPTLPGTFVDAIVSADLKKRWTCADTLALVRRNAVRRGTAGGAAAFNGVNYAVLSMVIEKVTGQPLAVALRTDLLAPASLPRIWTQAGSEPERPQPPIALPVDDPGQPLVDASGYLPSAAAATGFCGDTGIAADAPDLARWGYLLYGGRVLDDRLVTIMTTPNPRGGDFNYGFGTMISDGGPPLWGHAGNDSGYTSVLFAWPQTSTAVAVLVPMTGGPENDTRADLARELYESLHT